MGAPPGNQYAVGNPGGAGRPTDYSPEMVSVAKEMCESGATDRELAEMFGVSVTTLNIWKHKHKDFCFAIRLGKEAAITRVERSLYARAVGYDHDSVKITVLRDGTEVYSPFVEHVPPDPNAAVFFLKNRASHEWRDKFSQEISGPDGGPIATSSEIAALGAADLGRLAGALEQNHAIPIKITDGTEKNGNGNGRH